ncbi:hypothetical protein WN944_012547 [Citrus x changshan-huyou]|uniref:Uncharacterized protein n=1 Tax=Citrus x changshan-huyou TaxID=2935761 RepID=A0AAP0QZ32_9ROSI
MSPLAILSGQDVRESKSSKRPSLLALAFKRNRRKKAKLPEKDRIGSPPGGLFGLELNRRRKNRTRGVRKPSQARLHTTSIPSSASLTVDVLAVPLETTVSSAFLGC